MMWENSIWTCESKLRVQVRRVRSIAPLPVYQTPESSGMDLHACILEPIELKPLDRTKVTTGIAIAIPMGFEGQIRPRSGYAANNGLTVINTPGTIDSDYRGEICVAIVNVGNVVRRITPGDRIAQIVFMPVVRVEWVEVDKLDDTQRGTGGFGSTGE